MAKGKILILDRQQLSKELSSQAFLTFSCVASSSHSLEIIKLVQIKTFYVKKSYLQSNSLTLNRL